MVYSCLPANGISPSQTVSDAIFSSATDNSPVDLSPSVQVLSELYNSISLLSFIVTSTVDISSATIHSTSAYGEEDLYSQNL